MPLLTPRHLFLLDSISRVILSHLILLPTSIPRLFAMRVALYIHMTGNNQTIGIEMRPLETPIGFLRALIAQPDHLFHLIILSALLAS